MCIRIYKYICRSTGTPAPAASWHPSSRAGVSLPAPQGNTLGFKKICMKALTVLFVPYSLFSEYTENKQEGVRLCMAGSNPLYISL